MVIACRVRVIHMISFVSVSHLGICMYLPPDPLPKPPVASSPSLEANALPEISTRALSSWEDSIQKGQNFLCAMEQPLDANPLIVEQSTWTSEADLATYGWNIFANPLQQGQAGIFGLDDAFRALGISSPVSSYGDWANVNMLHSATTTQGDTVYPATNAIFNTLFNGKMPTLVAKMSYGPKYMAERNHVPLGGNNQLPPVQRWSDLNWLGWQKITSNKDGPTSDYLFNLRASLEHVFRYQVSNDDTKDIVRRARGGGTIADPTEIPPVWPGWEFTPSTTPNGFRSILSSPNVFGIVYLLASHKGEQQFKLRTIDRINAFNCPSNLIPNRPPEARWCLYLHITAVETPEQG